MNQRLAVVIGAKNAVEPMCDKMHIFKTGSRLYSQIQGPEPPLISR
jgi:hypothetical protein